MVATRLPNQSDIVPLAFSVLAKSAVQVSHTGDTAEFTLATITLPANTLGPNGVCRIRADVSCTSSANIKSFRARLGGIAGSILGSFPATAIASGQMEIIFSNRNSASSQYSNGIVTRGTDQLMSSPLGVTYAVNTGVSQDIVITGQNALAGETFSLERYFVEVLYGA